MGKIRIGIKTGKAVPVPEFVPGHSPYLRTRVLKTVVMCELTVLFKLYVLF